MNTKRIDKISYDALGINIRYNQPVNGSFETKVPFLCPVGNKIDNASGVLWDLVHKYTELQNKLPGSPRY